MSRNAKRLLEQWGIWTHQKTGEPRYTSPMLALMRDHVPSAHSPDAAITEEDAEEVSALLARLSRDTEPSKARGGWNGAQISEVLHLFYRNRLSQAYIGDLIGRNRQQVASMIDSGEWYVQAALDMADSIRSEKASSKSASSN